MKNDFLKNVFFIFIFIVAYYPHCEIAFYRVLTLKKSLRQADTIHKMFRDSLHLSKDMQSSITNFLKYIKVKLCKMHVTNS
jgi:hypothetical protein